MLKLRFFLFSFLAVFACHAQGVSTVYDSAVFYFYGRSHDTSISLVSKLQPKNDSLSFLGNSIHAFALYDQNRFKECEQILKRVLTESSPRALRIPAQVLFANLKFISNKADSAVLITRETIREVELFPVSSSRDQLLATLYLNLGYFTTPRTVSKNDDNIKYLMESFDTAEKYIISSRNINGQLFAYLYLYRALAFYNCGHNTDQVGFNLIKAYEYNARLSAPREFSKISGYLFYNMNHIEEAVQFLKETDLNPWYAMALVKSGRINDGLKIFSSIINSPTPHPYEKSEACYFLSEYYLQTDHTEALKYFRMAKLYDLEAAEMEYSIYSINRSSNVDLLNEKFHSVISELQQKEDDTHKLIPVICLIALAIGIVLLFVFYWRKRKPFQV